MIICGDISLSKKGAVIIERMPSDLLPKVWFGNLEGTLIEASEDERMSFLKEHGVFNSTDAIKELLKQLNFAGFGLSNNHIFNYGNARMILDNTQKLEVQFAGLGENLSRASMPAVITDENGQKYTIFSFAWRLTESKVATENEQGVNPWKRKHALSCVKQAVRAGSKNVIVFVHWNYEMNYLPFPYDRQLAHELIDAGVTAVIGCHSHRVAPVEVYKGKPIIYGLGNFLFENNVYFNGELNFPEISEKEYAFEINEKGVYKIHVFHFDTKENVLHYVRTEELTEKKGTIDNLSNVTAEEYEKQYKEYFKSKPRRQRILCPIFNTNEPAISLWIKEKERDLHETLLKMVVNLHLHKGGKSGKTYK